jgi:hypothetical protein
MLIPSSYGPLVYHPLYENSHLSSDDSFFNDRGGTFRLVNLRSPFPTVNAKIILISGAGHGKATMEMACYFTDTGDILDLHSKPSLLLARRGLKATPNLLLVWLS